MQEIFRDFHFIRPAILILLIFPFFMLFFKNKIKEKFSAWENVCDKNLLNFLLIRGKNSARNTLFFVILTALVSSIFAASGPSYKQINMPAMYQQNPVMTVLELSSDMKITDVKPDRLSRAKFLIKDLLQNIPETQSGLIVYSDEPFLISPISEDYRIIENLLPVIDNDIMPVNGNRADRALDFAIQKLQDAQFNVGNIILLASDIGSNYKYAIDAAKRAVERNYTVSVVNVSEQQNELLQKIAQAGGGQYLNINGNTDKLENFIANKYLKDVKLSGNKSKMWMDFGYYLLFIPIICCLYLFRRGMLFAFIVCIYMNNAYAGFFKNNNQEAFVDFQNKNYEQAAKKFSDKNWQASALYKAEKYELALEKFADDNSVTGMYNQANSLAKSGKIQEAIKLYEKVLENDATHEDAKFNLEYLKQQQNNQQQQSENDDKQNNENDNEQQENNSQNSDGNNQEQNMSSAQGSQDNQQDKQNKQQQDSENQNNSEKNEQNEQSLSQQDNQKNSDNNDNNNADLSAKSQSENMQQNQDKQEKTDEQNLATQPLKSDADKSLQEEAMARAQQYRKIDDDPGGLLRGFIYQEYQKNRYKD